MKTVAIVSGGLDSTTLAYYLKDRGDELYMLSFDYGQKHWKEIEYARKTARRLAAPHQVIDLLNLKPLLNSALTDDQVEVPEGHYAAENMAATVVPNRNSIMLSIAYGWAVTLQADYVAFGVHSGDHPIYPDCREEFVDAFGRAETLANEGYANPLLTLVAPFIDMTKGEIVALGGDLEVPYEDTWSCYKGGAQHCGRCGTCVERKEAFWIAKVVDPTSYEDAEYAFAAYRGQDA